MLLEREQQGKGPGAEKARKRRTVNVAGMSQGEKSCQCELGGVARAGSSKPCAFLEYF